MNNAMKIMIVDDEPLAVKLLESFVARTPDLELTGSFTDSIAALEALRTNPPHLLLLDIQMPDMNGMELAHAIDNEQTRIIFTTAFKDFAYESYEVNALDFLLKPIRYVKFLGAIEKARKFWSERGEASSAVDEPVSAGAVPSSSAQSAAEGCFLRVDGELRYVLYSRIVYVESMKDYVKVYLEDEQSPLVTHLTMSGVEGMLPESRFMRIHRSFIISLSHIRSIDRNGCVYIADQIIRVTEAYRETFDAYVSQHMPQ